MRILIVSSSFYPELSPRSFRATELAKEYCRQGHEVKVLSKHRDVDYNDFLAKYQLSMEMWGRPRFPSLSGHYRKPLSHIIKGVSRLLALLFEYPVIEEMFQVKKYLKKESAYDLMISFAVPFPVHWGVAWARTDKKPIADTWVADCGDPYMFARLDRFRKPFYFKFPEVYFSKKCDYISIPFKDLEMQFYARFRSKMRVIPQGFNFDEIKLYKGPIDHGRPVFIFAGSVIPGKRDLALILDFLSSGSWDFQFIVYTNQKEWFARYKKIMGDKLILNDYIDRISLIFEMSKVDFLLNVDTIHDSQSNVEAIPSKLIDYALSGRPILNIKSQKLDEDLLVQFLEKDYNGQRIIRKSDYDIRNVSAKFLDLLD